MHQNFGHVAKTRFSAAKSTNVPSTTVRILLIRMSGEDRYMRDIYLRLIKATSHYQHEDLRCRNNFII